MTHKINIKPTLHLCTGVPDGARATARVVL